MTKIETVDVLLYEDEIVYLKVLVSALKIPSGNYVVSDVIRGNRTAVELSRSSFKSVFVNQHLNAMYEIYRINKQNDPEYFL